MNMKHFQHALGLSLLVSLLTSTFSLPIVVHQQPQHTGSIVQPTGWYPSSSEEKPPLRLYPDLHYVYQSDDPTANYSHPAIVPVMPSGYPYSNYVYQPVNPSVNHPHPATVPEMPSSYPSSQYVYQSTDLNLNRPNPATVPVMPSSYPNSQYVYQPANPTMNHPHPVTVPAMSSGYSNSHYVYLPANPSVNYPHSATVPAVSSGYPNSHYMYQPVDPSVYHLRHPLTVEVVPSDHRLRPVVQNVTKFHKDDDQRSPAGTEFFNQVFARIMNDLRSGAGSRGLTSDGQYRLNDANDEPSEPSEPFEPFADAFGNQDMDPEFLNEVEATLYEITGGQRDKREKQVANNTVGSQQPYFGNSAYIYHPAPASLMQSIEQGPVAESSLYQNNYAIPPSSFATMGTGSLPEPLISAYDNVTNPFVASLWQRQYSFNPAFPFRPSPMMPPMMPPMMTSTGPQTFPADPMFYHNFPTQPSPTSAGLVSSAYTSQDQASYYLQPVYTNGVPVASTLFQVWPTSGQEQKPSVPDSDDTNKVLGPNSSEGIPQDSSSGVTGKPSVETNLTKIHVDPAHEKKINNKFQAYTAGNSRVVNEKRNILHGSHKSVRNPSVRSSIKENQSRRRHNKPFVPPVKQVLVPYYPTGREASFPSVDEEVEQPQRYRVYSQILKTYVPVSR